ncbi:ABC transporter substrate-binding protein [Aerosakkonema sp. BLCC-F183]|uniref:bifunctional serine/threonine-protein kinase/ABC transporter substrate-binding protein n=1 Tax=Aerosakkonema sp. BLCC-F183 TaxID=3342834 RepID=UPI0035B90906
MGGVATVSYCLNPNCPNPSDPLNSTENICRSCGSRLLLQERYRVIKPLGKGGFAQTFDVVDDLGTVKVLKLLNTAGITDIRSKEKLVKLFQQEAEVLSQLNYPGIPKGEGFSFPFWPKDSQEPLHCLVMEKIEGINLQSWLKNRGNQPITSELALEWLKQLAEILHQVHQQNYFHRDIKPPNIMLTPEGKLVLIDFGAVREFTQTYLHQQNVTGTVIGSSGYAPPEQLRGWSVQQSDFFALGRTFVHLLTGKHPLDLHEDPQTGKLIWRNSVPHISKFGSNFIDKLMGRSLLGLIDELMEPSCKKRPKNTKLILKRIKKIGRLPIPEIVGGATLILTGTAAVVYWYLTGVQGCAKISLKSFPKGDSLSCGEEILVPYFSLSETQAGVDAFFANNYKNAVDLLEKAWQKRHNPETLIYLNNARLTAQKAEAYTIAVVAPIGDKTLNTALEILRGVAQAQDEFNSKRKPGQAGIKVLIANDENQPVKAKKIAEALVSKKDVLAVIGHYTSEVTLAALDVYDRNLVLVSPTSTSEDLSNKSYFFFRTASSDRVSAQALANYLITQVQQRKVAVFYNPKSSFSQSIRYEFHRSFRTIGGQVVKDFDLSDPSFIADVAIEQAQKQGATALALLPDGQTSAYTFGNTLKAIKANRKGNLIVAGDTLYGSEILQLVGPEASSRLAVAVPWHHLSSPNREFSRSTEKLWGGEVSPRTALSYDAVMVLIKAIQKNSHPNRLNVQQVLAEPSFQAIGATGVVSFESNGNRKEPVVVLVKVVASKCSPYGYIFVPIKYSKVENLGCASKSTFPE